MHALTLAASIGGLSLVLTACGSSSDGASPTADPGDITVVTTTTILGDVVDDIVECAGGTNTTIMPIGADPHEFSPSSADVAQMVQADVVISNGLGLEAGLTDALAGASEDGAEVIEIAAQIDPIPFGAAGDHSDEGHSDEGHSDEEHSDEGHSDEGHSDEGHSDEGHSDDEAHDHGSLDPHFWFDMSRMAKAAVIIGDDLAKRGGAEFARCGQQVSDEILQAELAVEEVLATVPDERRVLVTDHDALEYFAQAYGFEVVGTVIPAGTTLAEPSSAQLQELVAILQKENVPAIFANTAEPSVLADAVAAEVGSDVVVVPLFVGSLGAPDSAAATYVDMMLANANLIAEALRN